MSKGFVALLAFTMLVLVAATPTYVASQQPVSSYPPNDLQTKVIQDTEGNVHVLWLVPLLNNSATSPGVWYSKYTPNGTDAIPPIQLTNSTGVQSADLAVDSKGNAIIVWADDARTPRAYSALYLIHFNSTRRKVTSVLTERGSLIMWPSLALDGNQTEYVAWSEYNPTNSHAIVECGIFTAGILTNRTIIASYPRANAFPPQASIVYDNGSRDLQLAWGESEEDGWAASTVNYAKLDSNGTVFAKLLVAKFASTLRDVAITPMLEYDGAFVSWQTSESNSSVYVSEISPGGELAYVKELNYTTGQSRYLALSTDAQGSLYVVWYQPSIIGPQTVTSSPVLSTNVAYLRMNIDGNITQTGSGVFQAPVVGVTVLNNGIVYGVSPDGLVKVANPNQQQNNALPIAAMAFMSCLSLAGFASSLWVEEGRYRWASLLSKLVRSKGESPTQSEALLKTLARKPGLKLREISHLDGDHRVGLVSLLEMERKGLLASLRDGLSRRFYVKNAEVGQTDALRTRILLWIRGHPEIWEAQLAKDLGLSQQIVHYHLRKLSETKLITAAVDENGCRKLFRLADKSHHQESRDTTRSEPV